MTIKETHTETIAHAHTHAHEPAEAMVFHLKVFAILVKG